MNINFTKKEYRLLLDIFSIADWVMNSHTVGDNRATEPYRMLEQKFMSYAKDFECENLIKYDKKLETYFQTAEYEDLETDSRFIDAYEEEVFWEELCSRLAQRDLLEEKGQQPVKEMDPIQRMSEEDLIAERYNTEFMENGLKNLKIR